MMSNKPKYAIELLREAHKRDHPNCNYGNEPHFVPPSFGQIGFYMCDPPEDITNHIRCRPPYDHEHADHLADILPTEMPIARFEYDMERAAAILAELMATPMELRLNTAAVVFRIITQASDDPFPLLPSEKLNALNSVRPQ